MHKLGVVAITALLFTACQQVSEESGQADSVQPADTVYHTGKIYTLDSEQPWAQAVAIRGGRIEFVGSDDAVRAFVGPDTAVVNLRGHMMMPAFQDSHMHPIGAGLDELNCYLGDADSLEAYQAVVAECAARSAGKKWITGGGWSMSVFGPGARASKEILDLAAPDHAVYLTAADGHAAWVNSRALELAGIDNDTPDPIDGFIDRDPKTGEAIGSLQEGAMSLVRRLTPDPNSDELVEALTYARDYLHSLGITAYQAAATDADALQAYEQLDRQGELNLRVSAGLYLDTDNPDEPFDQFKLLRDRYTKGNLRVSTIKIFIDGVMENYTAFMLDPYQIESESPVYGKAYVTPDQLEELVGEITDAGFQIHFHALGDAAVRLTLDAIEATQALQQGRDLRHHMAHLQVVHPDDHGRFKELGVTANFQPLWAFTDDYILELTLPFVSDEAARWMYPIKSILDTGATVAFGSDWPVSTVNPMPLMETAITRVDPDTHATEIMNPEQRIKLEQAIHAFTLGTAYINHLDDVTGSVEVGKFADLVVLDQNLFDIDPQSISDTKVLLTLFAGDPVFGDPAEF